MIAEVYTVAEVADKMGLGKNAAYEALKRGEIPCIPVGRRRIIPRAAFDRWFLSAGKPEAPPLRVVGQGSRDG